MDNGEKTNGLWQRLQKTLNGEDRLRPAEAVGGAVLVIAGVPVLLFCRVYLIQTAAVVAILMGVAALWGRLSVLAERGVKLPWVGQVTWKRVVSEAWGPVLIVVLTAAVYWPMVLGHMPWMADNLVHQYKGYVVAEHLIPSGRLTGWTHLSGAGYPAGQLYPILGDVWVAVVRFATFKQLSWEATYAWALFLVLLFCNLTPYYVARRLFGPTAGVVAAIFVMVDQGGFREGGWTFTVRYGVWPLAMGVSLGLLVLERLVNLAGLADARNGSTKPVPLKGVLSLAAVVALALLAHPISLLMLVVALPLFCIYMQVFRKKTGMWVRSFGGAALGFALAAFWFLPYLVNASTHSAHVSNLWQSTIQVAAGLLNANLFESTWAWALVLGVVGAVVAALERRPGASFLAALSVLLLLAGSITIYAATDVENWLPSVNHVQFQRFVVFVKLIWALMAGFFVQRLLFGLSENADGGPAVSLVKRFPLPSNLKDRLKRRGLQALGLAVVAPLVGPLIQGVVAHQLAPLSQFANRRQGIGWMGDYMKMVAELRRRAKEKRNDGFFRVAYWTDFNDHDLASGPVLTGLAQVKCSYIPAETYRYLVHPQPSDIPRTARDFQVMNVRYILARKRLPPSVRPVRELMGGGGLTLYEFEGYSPDRVTLLGPGTAEVLAFEDEEIKVRIKGAGPSSELVVHTPYFPNWKAELNGKSVSIRTHHDLAPNVKGLMKIRAADGVVTFTYRQTAVDWLGTILSFLTVLFLVWVIFVRRGWGWAVRPFSVVSDRVSRFAVPLRWAGRGLLGVAVVALGLKWCTAPDLSKTGRSLTWDLDRARVYLKKRGGRYRCRYFLDGRFVCGTKAYQYVGPVSEEWGLRNRRGLWAHPHSGAVLVIEYPSTKMGKRLDLEWGLLKSSAGGRGTVRMAVFVNKRRLAEVSRRAAGWAGPRRLDTAAWAKKRATIRFEIRADDISARHFVFDARIMP